MCRTISTPIVAAATIHAFTDQKYKPTSKATDNVPSIITLVVDIINAPKIWTYHLCEDSQLLERELCLFIVSKCFFLEASLFY